MEVYRETDMFEGAGVLPELLAALRDGEGANRILFCTYKYVRGHENGHVDTGDDDLEIIIESGGHNVYSPESMLDVGLRFALASRGIVPMNNGSTLMNVEGQSAQRKLEDRTEAMISEKPRLAFVYVGLSAFQESLAFAKKLRREHGMQVVVVTCTCNHGQIRHGAFDEFDHLIEVHACGAKIDMGWLVDYTLRAWNELDSVAA